MKYLLACIVLYVGFASVAEAQYPQPPIEAYGELPRISSAEISPDGEHFSLIVNMGEETRLIILDRNTEFVSQVGIGEIKARYTQFFDNKHVILTVSKTTRTMGFRGEYEASAAFSYNMETSKIRQLLHRVQGIFPAQSGLGYITGQGREENRILMPAYMGDRYSDPTFDLLTINLGNGRGRIQHNGTHDTIDWFTDGEGNALARERYDNQRNIYRIQWRDGRDWKTIYEKIEAIPSLFMTGVMPDKSGLVFASAYTEADGFDYLMKLGQDGKISGPILAREGREIASIYSNRNRFVLGVRYSGIEPEYDFLDDRLQTSVEFVQASLPDATVYLDSWSDDRSRVLYSVFDTALGNVWIVHDVETEALSLLASSRPDVPAEAIGPVFAITYKARDGLDIPAIVTLPPNKDINSSEKLPLIALPHGGPSSYDSLRFDWMAQFFANRGYVVLQPNFRGSTGFGKAFLDAGKGEWGGKMQDDITDGIKALATIGIADPERVCIVGASYGGYAALAGATFTPELYKCVIAIAPVSDLNRMLQDEKRQMGTDHWVVDYWEDLMANGYVTREKLDTISPAKFAEAVQAPILLVHGDDDTVVPINQSKIMERALQRADKDVELVRLKGEDHWLSVAETRLQLLQEMDAFLKEHLPVTAAD